jgi:hypothetical protein
MERVNRIFHTIGYIHTDASSFYRSTKKKKLNMQKVNGISFKIIRLHTYIYTDTHLFYRSPKKFNLKRIILLKFYSFGITFSFAGTKQTR